MLPTLLLLLYLSYTFDKIINIKLEQNKNQSEPSRHVVLSFGTVQNVLP